MKVSVIVAVAENGVIGRDNELPWRLADDLKRFKALTMGHHVLVGRKTFESIGRALPGREMIVVSRGAPDLPEGVHLADSVEAGIERASSYGEDELFVAGGAAIYQAALPLADKLYFTKVHTEVEGDVRFPELDMTEWTRISKEHRDADEENAYATCYFVYERTGEK